MALRPRLSPGLPFRFAFASNEADWTCSQSVSSEMFWLLRMPAAWAGRREVEKCNAGRRGLSYPPILYRINGRESVKSPRILLINMLGALFGVLFKDSEPGNWSGQFPGSRTEMLLLLSRPASNKVYLVGDVDQFTPFYLSVPGRNPARETRGFDPWMGA